MSEQFLPLLLSARQVADLLGIGLSTFWRLHSSGQTPAAVRLGRCTRWNRLELLAWIDAGAPCRDKWEVSRGNRR